MQTSKSNPRVLEGRIVSDKMQKTAVVLVERYIKHKIYGKFIRRSTKLHAHNDGDYKLGDMVRIMETRPIAKHKSWAIIGRV